MDMSRIHPECLDPGSPDQPTAADVLLRHDPDEEDDEDEEEDDGGEKEDDGEDEGNDGYSE